MFPPTETLSDPAASIRVEHEVFVERVPQRFRFVHRGNRSRSVSHSRDGPSIAAVSLFASLVFAGLVLAGAMVGNGPFIRLDAHDIGILLTCLIAAGCLLTYFEIRVSPDSVQVYDVLWPRRTELASSTASEIAVRLHQIDGWNTTTPCPEDDTAQPEWSGYAIVLWTPTLYLPLLVCTELNETLGYVESLPPLLAASYAGEGCRLGVGTYPASAERKSFRLYK